MLELFKIRLAYKIVQSVKDAMLSADTIEWTSGTKFQKKKLGQPHLLLTYTFITIINCMAPVLSLSRRD